MSREKINEGMPISIDNLRVGLRYRLENYGDKVEFEVLEKLSDNDFRVKDLHTLEVFHFQDLVRYGMSKDYELREMHWKSQS